MNRLVNTTSRPQLALQSYLDSLLQDATEEMAPEIEALAEVVETVRVVEEQGVLDEFQAAVLEEQARDAQKTAVVAAPATAPLTKTHVAVVEAPEAVLASVSTLAPLLQTLVVPAIEEPAALLTPVIEAPQTLVLPVVEVHLPPSNTPPPVESDGRPSWAAEPFECLLFDVAGLTLAVPLVCLGSIYLSLIHI